jgi:glutaminyl-peptide cyclotransferase
MDKRWVAAVSAALILVVLAGVLAVALYGGQSGNPSANGPVNYTYSVVKAFPHDTAAFTEGLVFSNGSLYESTGEYGESSLRRVDLNSGTVLQEYNLSSEYFGEGLTAVNGNLVQLTWANNVGFVYDANSFAVVRNFSYSTQGWGLTYDGTNLIVSDGDSTLIFLNPQTFQVTRQVDVRDANQSITNINELEYINGDIYANIWMTNKIAIINPQTGAVKGWIDLTGIYQRTSYDSVLNGIAYDQQDGRLFVTGKNWPNLYEISIKPVA